MPVLLVSIAVLPTYGIAAIITVFVLDEIVSAQKLKHRRKLKAEYNEALNSGDKQRALEAGRTYYRSWRPKRNLTDCDERAIAKYLEAIK